MASSTFKDFDLASTQQRPDSVLRRRRRQKQTPLESSASNSVVARPSATRRFVRLAVMGLTVALGAAALAVVNTALEWAPKLDLFPWAAWASLLPFCDISVYAWWVFFSMKSPQILKLTTLHRPLGETWATVLCNAPGCVQKCFFFFFMAPEQQKCNSCWCFLKWRIYIDINWRDFINKNWWRCCLVSK